MSSPVPEPGRGLRATLGEVLREAAQRPLEHRRRLAEDLRSELASTEALVASLDSRAAAATTRLDGVCSELRLLDAPFSAELTVDQAWRRHPGARAVFARHGLPDCDGCSVRFDETLAEVAEAYALPLDALLGELQALLPSPPTPTST